MNYLLRKRTLTPVLNIAVSIILTSCYCAKETEIYKAPPKSTIDEQVINLMHDSGISGVKKSNGKLVFNAPEVEFTYEEKKQRFCFEKSSCGLFSAPDLTEIPEYDDFLKLVKEAFEMKGVQLKYRYSHGSSSVIK